MKETRATVRPTSVLFALTLVAVFTISSLFVVLFGAKVYQSIAHSAQRNYEMRTGASYVTNKIRSADHALGVSVKEEAGVKVLVLAYGAGQSTYWQYLYLFENNLCEALVTTAQPFAPKLGQKIIEAKGFDCNITGNLVEFTISDEEGNQSGSSVALYANAGGAA